MQRKKRHKVSERELRGILNATRESIWMFSTDGIILLANSTATKRFGKSEQEVTGKQIADILPVELAISRWERLQEVVRTAAPLEFEDERAGMHFRHSFYPVTDDEGTVVSVVSFSRDITSQKMAESVLQNTLDRFYLMLSSMYSGVLLMTDDGKVEFLNKAFCDFYEMKEEPSDLIGITSAELLEKIKDAYLDPEKSAARIIQIIREMQPVSGEEFSMKNGQTAIRDFIPLKVHGKSSGRMWIHTDITTLTETERELRRANEELTLFNQAMIGRELRMIELKMEVNRLSVEAGRPPVYNIDPEEV